MKPDSVKILDRSSAVYAINRMNEEDLLFLNRLIVERLKLDGPAKTIYRLGNASIGMAGVEP